MMKSMNHSPMVVVGNFAFGICDTYRRYGNCRVFMAGNPIRVA